MASQEDILRVAKILARATSSEPNEANVALQSAYKRMRRDQVGIRHLLTLPLEELYQEALVKLVILILENQENLSPPERRKAFENFMSLITVRFSNGDVDIHENLKSSNQKEKDFHREQEDNIRRQAEKTRQEEAHQREEKKRRTASDETKAQQYKSEQDYSPEGGNSADIGARSPQPSRKPKEPTSLFAIFVSIIGLISIIIILNTGNGASKTIQSSAKSIPILSVPKVKIQDTIVFEATHSVAALNANLRSKPSSRSIIKTVLKRGDALKVISKLENFLEVQLPTGEVAFIAKDLVIPIEDLSRLANITARDYFNNRFQDKRVDLLIHQADTEAHKIAFNLVIYDLIIESESIDKSLEKLQVVQKFDIEPDISASTWFALSTNAAMQSNNYEDAFLEARAAIEADPVNPENYVAFGLASYQLKNYEAVKFIGALLPKIAPTSTNAWILFALANALTPESNDQLTKSAFVLAIKLSRNANNTRRYFREFAEKTSELRIRELLTAALLQETEDPKIFTNASRLIKVVQVNQP